MYNTEVTKMEELEIRNRIKAMSITEQQIVVDELPTSLLIKTIAERNHLMEQTLKQVRSHLER